MTRSSGWKKAGSVKTRRFSNSWRTDTSSSAVVNVILSSPDNVMLLSNVCRNPHARIRCGSRKCQRNWKLIHTKDVTLSEISQKEFMSYFSQGVDTTDTRQVSTKVPLGQVPYIMRALGFYPTEQEVRPVRVGSLFFLLLVLVTKVILFLFVSDRWHDQRVEI